MSSGEGIVEPIKIEPFKKKSAGLGQAAAKEEECRKRLKMEQARLTAYKVSVFIMLYCLWLLNIENEYHAIIHFVMLSLQFVTRLSYVTLCKPRCHSGTKPNYCNSSERTKAKKQR